MTKYQLVPYIVRVNVRNMASESRALDNLDAADLDLATELSGLLGAHLGKIVVQPNTKAQRPHKLQVVEVGAGVRTLCFTIAPGHSGIESEIRKPDGTIQKRDFDDTELVSLRHFMTYKAGSHRAILWAERVGGDGAISALRTLLTQVWNTRHTELTLSIAPAGDEKIWDSMLADRPVVKYQMTRTTTTDGRLAVTKKPAEYTLDVRPVERGGRFSLGATRKKARETDLTLRQILLEDVSPILAPEYATPEEGAAALVDDGWSVAVQLELESGQKPIVNVESNATVTLTFPIIDGQEEPTSRPTNSDVSGAVKRLVEAGVLSTWDFSPGHGAGLSWIDGPCEYEGEPWKVVWDVDDPDGTPDGNAQDTAP